MATKKKLTPAECDRWDTVADTTKTTSKPTDTQKKALEKWAAEKKKPSKGKK